METKIIWTFVVALFTVAFMINELFEWFERRK
mgnify:FL=1